MSNEKKKQQGAKTENSYSKVITRFNEITEQYSQFLPYGALLDSFARVGYGQSNMPQIQNGRVKAISSLPVDYSKEDIGDYLRNPYQNEKPLRETAEVLRWTAYPFFKITKLYQDIPTYKHYFNPLYIEKEDFEEKEFKREAVLLNKLNKELSPEMTAHKIVGQAVTQGKVFYVPRIQVDKTHNKVDYAFLQQLPEDYCWIIGFNNISGYTVSFDLMYFMQMGTDWRQFGDLFKPYMNDFAEIFAEPKKEKKFVYASCPTVKCRGQEKEIHIENVKENAVGNPNVFMQNGRWCYYVTLPIEKVWTFEIDDTTTAIASPLSGLMLTYSQQADYEAAQLSLLLNPLIKIFTGEIPYFTDDGSQKDDDYRLSVGGRQLFETLFNTLMSSNNTSGASFFTAPVENIKSHDFNESANANDISLSFNRYADSKAGLSALLPADDEIKAAQVDSSQRIESKYAQVILWQYEKMIREIYKSLKLRYDWDFHFIGDIFFEKETREYLEKEIARGDTSAYFKLSALDGESWVEKISMLNAIKAIKLTDLLEVPQTAYTQSGSGDNGRPKTEGISSEAKEKAIDSGVTKQ